MKKRLQWIFIVMFLPIFTFTSTSFKTEKSSQRIERHVIVFKINYISTYEESANIDAFLTSKDGILASRTNHISSTYFCFSLKSKDLKKLDFENWFSELGYSITCFDKVVHGEGIVLSNDELENCKQ